jgi:two-component system, NtrC family, sensor kinase
MFIRFTYRIQIPLGLSLAVLIATLLTTALTANISVKVGREDTLARVDRAVALLSAQAKPLIAADDVWRVFALLRNTTALLPGANSGLARAAILDSDGRVFASSNPKVHEISQPILGHKLHGIELPKAELLKNRVLLTEPTTGVSVIEPVLSDDGQVLGFVYIEVDKAVFLPNWLRIAQPALLGLGITVLFLIPLGWWVGRRMARPVADIAKVISQIGKVTPATLRKQVPHSADPELAGIGNAVLQLLNETETREKAEARALSSERLAAVGRITAVVAHEINNPLAGLLTATQTLRLHGSSETIRPRTVELIERGLQQIRSTVNALLPQARFDDRALMLDDLFDIGTLVQPTAMRYKVNVHVRQQLESAPRVPSAPLRQVMLNLLLNAVKAAGENGEVFAILKADANIVQFEVINSGPVLNAALLASTIAAESGNEPHGFGLWVCQEIAVQFHGNFGLDVTSLDRTRIIFKIPNLTKKI